MPETPHFPGRAPIDAYGNGGFRFAGMSHRGSLLMLPSGIWAWEAVEGETLDAGRLARALGEARSYAFLILGTGTRQVFPSTDLKRAFEAADLGLEVMDTGAACRTYNTLLAEGRAVAAALIAVV